MQTADEQLDSLLRRKPELYFWMVLVMVFVWDEAIIIEQ